MWDFLKRAGQAVVDAGAMCIQTGQLVQRLFSLPQEQALKELQSHVAALDDAQFRAFLNSLATIAATERQHATNALNQRQTGPSWGSTFEDQLAQGIAEFQGGRSGPSAEASAFADAAAQRAAACEVVAQLAQQFRAARTAPPTFVTTPPPPLPSGQSASAAPERSSQWSSGFSSGFSLGRRGAVVLAEARALLAELKQRGKFDPKFAEVIAELQNHPAEFEAFSSELGAANEAAGADEPLDAAQHYRPGLALSNAPWPISPTLPLPVPFAQLGPEIQFHVLFAECIRRLFEGDVALNNGTLEEARATFLECVDRGEFLQVAELAARGHDGCMRVAQRRGDSTAEEESLERAAELRSRAAQVRNLR